MIIIIIIITIKQTRTKTNRNTDDTPDIPQLVHTLLEAFPRQTLKHRLTTPIVISFR